MTDLRPSDAAWEACPPGLLSGYPQKIHRRRMFTIAATTAGSFAGVAATGWLGWTAYMHRLETEYQFHGLTCADVRELLPAYRSHQLDARRSELLEKHVQRCPQCQRFRAELHPAVS